MRLLFIGGCKSGKSSTAQRMARALDLSRLNEAAYRSAQSHQPVALDTLEE